VVQLVVVLLGVKIHDFDRSSLAAITSKHFKDSQELLGFSKIFSKKETFSGQKFLFPLDLFFELTHSLTCISLHWDDRGEKTCSGPDRFSASYLKFDFSLSSTIFIKASSRGSEKLFGHFFEPNLLLVLF
jgi:hypothetical protein